ncbi:protein-export membrane protein SecD [Mesorhizobium robiniae]|uniref:Protein-export membrane protein SecD n=1 Tax=Mesorhizobium robiniae TaxID=559315 RepID=A0ABV2GN36_9HYPH
MLYLSRFKMTPIWVAVAITGVLGAPGLFAASPLAKQPDGVPKLQIAGDLDQQGGSHILLSLDLDDLIKGRLETTRDEIRSLLRSARIGYTGLARSGRTVQVRISDSTQVEAAKTALKTLTDPVAASGSIQETTLDESEPGGLLKFTATDAGITYGTSTALAQSIEVIKRRIYELGITEPIVQQQGDDRILIQMPGLKDPKRLSEILGRTAKLTIQLVDQSMPVRDALSGQPPIGSSVLYSQDDPPVPYLIENRVIVSGENLIDAQAKYNSQSNESVVSFPLDSKGAARLGQATSQNIGKLIAILDDQVISVPVIREPVLGGSGQISGNFTAQNAEDIALMLRAGPLPARLTIVEESPMAAPK